MALNLFTRRFGATQGRIRPSGVPAVLGDYVFALGSDLAGDFQRVVTGDKIELTQAGDVTSVRLIRFRAKVRAPSAAGPYAYIDTADGTAGIGALVWTFWWGIGATRHGERTLTPGRTFEITDGAIDVSQLAGNQTIKFVLRAD